MDLDTPPNTPTQTLARTREAAAADLEQAIVALGHAYRQYLVATRLLDTRLAMDLDRRFEAPIVLHLTRAGLGGSCSSDGGRPLASRTVLRIVEDLGRRVGVRVWCHALRHSAITTAIIGGQQAGVGLDQIRAFSRHATLATMLVYRDTHDQAAVHRQLADVVAASLSTSVREWAFVNTRGRGRHFLYWSKNAASRSNVCLGFRPNSSFSSIPASFSPSTSSTGGAPSRTASLRASAVKDPVVMMIPLSARPVIAPRKSRTWLGLTEPAYFLH
jgi:hypothetical protein